MDDLKKKNSYTCENMGGFQSGFHTLTSPSRFHCCATCIHYEAKELKCKRLGYVTSPKYKFSCWCPKETVKKLMNKKNVDTSTS